MAEVQKDLQGEKPLLSKTFREWKGVFTQSSRVSIPEDHFYDLENVMPIGNANIHSIPDKVFTGVDYGADTVYWSTYVNILGVGYLISFSTTGKVFAYNIGAGTSATIATGFSGAGSRVTQFKNVAALFIDSSGFFSWDGTTFSGNLGGIAGSPSNGTEIAVYQGRVWVVQGRTIAYSGADDGTATPWTTLWTVANGAGFVQMTDPTFKSGITRLWVQNGYLYVFSASGINIISDVYVPAGASPPTPSFSNTNVNANIGTDQPGSVFAFGRSLCFATRYGIYQMYGVADERISSDIDGTWQSLDPSQALFGASATVFNILCAGVLFKQFADSDGDIPARTAVAMYFDGKWWFANYGPVTVIVAATVSNAPAMFGFVNNQLYQFFAALLNGVPTASPATRVITPLWAMEDALAKKNVIQAGIQTVSLTYTGTNTLYVDTTVKSSPVTGNVNPPTITFVNNAMVPIQFTGFGGANIIWTNSGLVILSGDAPAGMDNFVGLKYVTTSSIYELDAFYMDYKLGARWR